MPSTLDNAPLLSPEQTQRACDHLARLRDSLGQAILGQPEVLRQVMTCLVARGHVLLEGLPGLGKTELVKALSASLGLTFRRIQFTPDLLPSDILGASILEERAEGRRLVFHPGPVFTHLLLADEINRTTPKTQAALLEAMQEHAVTVMGETRSLPRPFFVLATQNPIELEGTYPLPEAQLDRFMAKIDVQAVSPDILEDIIAARSNGSGPHLRAVLGEKELSELFSLADRVHLPVAVRNYIARIVSASHPHGPNAPDEVQQFVRYGASPRAALAMAGMARAAALSAGKPNAGFDEVRGVAASVLRHRLILDYSARLEGISADHIVSILLESVPELDRDLPPDLKS